MKKQTILDKIEIERDGAFGLRFAKQIVDDDGTVLHSEWHRTMLPPGGDLDRQMAAVNANLAEMGAATVETHELARVKTLTPAVWTKDVMARHATREKARAEKTRLEQEQMEQARSAAAAAAERPAATDAA